MNYNSINEIFDAGISNMEVIRNNTKQDDGVDSINGVDWFAFNGTTASTIYASGNSFIGFGSSSEHLKVNRRDGALYSLYREEGTLYEYYKFLKIRWVGYSYYASIASNYALSYDVIIWDTGDISLRMIGIPSTYNNGTYSLVADTTYTYTVNTTTPDVTFLKTSSGFEVSNEIINLELPFEKRYLIRSGSNYYTVVDNTLSQLSITELNSESFLNYGTKSIPDISLLCSLTNPELLFWFDSDEHTVNEGLVIKGTPELPQVIYYESQDISNYSGIEKAEVHTSGYAKFAITFDDGQTWKYYDGTSWNIATSELDGMTDHIFKNISSNAWSEVITSTMFRIRCTLTTINSFASEIYIKYI